MKAELRTTEYERVLGSLEGNAFQAEVCKRLASIYMDFQRVPDKPSGDGGLDGLSHGHTVAYCCYGPQQEPFRVNVKGLKDAIVEKFRSDLRKLFELSTGPGGRLRRITSQALPDIIEKGVKIKHVYLVCSWFESHRVISPIATTFTHYKGRSAKRFVDPAASCTVWGPTDLANKALVDDRTWCRIEEQALLARLKTAGIGSVPAADMTDFDAKFDDLMRRAGPGRSDRVNELAAYFRKAWANAIALDNDLASTSVSLHEALERARQQSAVSAQLKSLQSQDPATLLGEMRQEVESRVRESCANRLETMISHVADGEVGRLIGDCHLDWRQ